jgi:hypothetical protein
VNSMVYLSVFLCCPGVDRELEILFVEQWRGYSASWKGNLRYNLRENADPRPPETRRVTIVVAAL